jgi:hypothetical protein
MDTQLDPNKLLALATDRKWLPLVAALIWLVVRLLKSDTKIPITIKPEHRYAAGIALGLIAAVVEKVATGETWTNAIVNGLVAWIMAMTFHEGAMAARKDRDFAIPGLIIPGVSSSPGKPPSLSPPPITVDRNAPTEPPKAGPLLAILFTLGLAGASLEACTPKQLAAAELLLNKAACVVANQDLSDVEVFAKCAVQEGDFQKYRELLSESRAATKKALQKQQASKQDAGACP